MTVELVGVDGEPVGECSVIEAHTPPGRLHRAFSVVLFDAAGRTLLQRRAAAKSRFGGLWSNSCCSHPAPGEPPTGAAVRRIAEELRLDVGTLTEAGRFTYEAADLVGGCVEHEYDHVLVGELASGGDPDPDPAEVDDWRWVDVASLRSEMANRPADFTPWFAQVLAIASPR
jgi:isopentenyl-diphosphate delta-isomerase